MTNNFPASVIGDQTGLAFPTTIEALRERGTEFLTDGFRKTGVMSATNRVTAITDFTEFFGGGMGRKLLLSVTYEHFEPDLKTDLFAKFPRDFGDPLRDLFGPLMKPEISFALLSRREGFPIAVPVCYFADYNEQTVSGILITERIGYGSGSILPMFDKCLDYEISEPLAIYLALTQSLAKLAGHHKSGKLGLGIETQFPFDPTEIDLGARIPYTSEQLHEKLQKLLTFAKLAPQLFEPHLLDPDFLAHFVRDAPLVLKHELEIRAFLNGASDYVALCHWNMNLDNAWFWRDAEGEIQAGLLDWGSVGQMNIAQAFFGMICSAETGFLNAHKATLLAVLVEQYNANGGPMITLDALTLMVKLATALLGVAWLIDAPSLIEIELPDFATLQSRHDQKLKENFLARAQLQLLMVFLNEWKVDDIGGAVKAFIAARGG